MPRYQKSGGFDRLNVSNLITTSSKQTVEDLTTAATLDAADSGKVFTLSLAGGFDVTLPSPGTAGAGWSAKFIVAVAPTANYTLTAATNVIHGHVATPEDASGASASTAGTAVDIVTFVLAKALIGDWVKLTSNGSLYFAEGVAAVQDGITLA